MKLINIEIGTYAKLTGYIHEPSNEMGNIQAYPGILILPGGGFRISGIGAGGFPEPGAFRRNPADSAWIFAGKRGNVDKAGG